MKRRSFLQAVASLAVLPVILDRDADATIPEPAATAPPRIPWERDEFGFYWGDYTIEEEFNTAQMPVGWWVSYCEDAVECRVPTFAEAEAVVLAHKDSLERRYEGCPVIPAVIGREAT